MREIDPVIAAVEHRRSCRGPSSSPSTSGGGGGAARTLGSLLRTSGSPFERRHGLIGRPAAPGHPPGLRFAPRWIRRSKYRQAALTGTWVWPSPRPLAAAAKRAGMQELLQNRQRLPPQTCTLVDNRFGRRSASLAATMHPA